MINPYRFKVAINKRIMIRKSNMLRNGIEMIIEGRVIKRLRLRIAALIVKIEKIPETKRSLMFFDFL